MKEKFIRLTQNLENAENIALKDELERLRNLNKSLKIKNSKNIALREELEKLEI